MECASTHRPVYKIALFGSKGQLGSAFLRLHKTLASLGQPLPHADYDLEIIQLSRPHYDLTNLLEIPFLVQTLYDQGCRIIVNAAAYTAVDTAESDSHQALITNWKSLQILADQMALYPDFSLIHFSTDYIFDGKSSAPYTEDDPPNPLNIYGLSKWAGEQAVRASLPRHFIFRISWVFGREGKNFVKTMLSLAQKNQELKVVNDQAGSPTYADDIARMVLSLIPRIYLGHPVNWGTYHYTGETPDRRPISWYDFARKIFEILSEHNLGEHKGYNIPHLISIPSKEFPQSATRPHYSHLNTAKFSHVFGLPLSNWQQGVREVIEHEIAHKHISEKD